MAEPRRLAGHAARLLPLLVATAFAISGLTRWPLGSAELWTVAVSQAPGPFFVDLVAGDRHPLLHPLLVRGLLAIADSDALIRLPSALGAIGATWFTLRAGERLGGSAAGPVAAFAVAISPLLVAYAGIARPYALVACVGAALLAGCASLRTDPRRGWLLLLVAGATGLHLHYAAALPVACAVAASFIECTLDRSPAERRRQLAAWAATWLLVGLAFLPWALGPLRDQLGHTAFGARNLAVLAYALWRVDELLPLGLVACLALALVGLLRVTWRGPRMLLPWIIGSALLPWLVSGSVDMQRRVYVHIGFLPLWGLLLALGALALWRRPLPWLLLLAGLLLPASVQLARLPSSPVGPHGSSLADDGIFDARADARLLAGLLGDGRRVVMQGELWVGLYARYAPGRFVHGTVDPARPEDWRADERHGRQRRTRGCVPEAAFPFVLVGPQGDDCAALQAALAASPAGRHQLAAATVERDPAVQESLLDRARAASPADPEPSLLLARLLLQQGRVDDALPVIHDGQRIAARWSHMPALSELSLLAAEAHTRRGDAAAADDARGVAACVARLSHRPMFSSLCLPAITRGLAPTLPGNRPER